MPRTPFFGVLLLMLGCGTAVWLGQPDPNLSFDSARLIWADVLRDADDIGLQLTRVSPAKEMQLGSELAGGTAGFGPEDAAADQYVQAVGNLLTAHLNRPAIQYHFHVVRSSEINAFALPGGQIFVFTGMMDFLQNEAELAAVLGHEMSHVDLRHCIERYQYEIALRRAGAGQTGEIVEFAHQLVALSYSQDQELEADAGGERLAIEAGYDPDAAPAVFTRLQVAMREGVRTPANTPAGEVGQAAGQVLEDFLRTHPPSEERSRQLIAMVAQNRRKLAGRTFYVGVRNYRSRTPRSAAAYAEEQRVY